MEILAKFHDILRSSLQHEKPEKNMMNAEPQSGHCGRVVKVMCWSFIQNLWFPQIADARNRIAESHIHQDSVTEWLR